MPRLPVILLACLACSAPAHESPSHSLADLNKHIAENPAPDLLFQRAMAYKELGKLDLAAADLLAASNAMPTHLPWQIERCRVELAASRPANALTIANTALKLAQTRDQRAEIHILRAQAYQSTGQFKPSLHACQLAFKEMPAGKIEWFLLRSDDQRELGLHRQRLHDLGAGLKSFPDTILKSHWIDALIDAGKHSEALAQIEKELPSLRWKAHWQLKQARALTGLDRRAEAEQSLHAALEEINGRLNPAQPDIFLLADQAHILMLLGDFTSARASLGELKKHRAPHWMTKRLESQLSKK